MDLTLKTTMLIALLSGQRCQTLHALNISDMTFSDKNCTFRINELLKTSRPGKHLGCLELRAFDEDKQLCVVLFLKEYVERTELLRGTHSQLLLSYCKPFKPVSTDTISRWLKKVLANAGININEYGAHSTRSASTSAARAANISVKTIMDAAGWANVETFRKFYDKPITDGVPDNFGYKLLKAVDVE